MIVLGGPCPARRCGWRQRPADGPATDDWRFQL